MREKNSRRDASDKILVPIDGFPNLLEAFG